MVVGWNGWNILFFRVMSEVRTRFKPSAVVCQCGVDTLASDPMASFNLTQQSIGECVKYLMNWNLPLLLLGGGKLWAINPNIQQGSSLSVLDKQLSHFACLPGPFLACCHCRFSYTRWLAQTLGGQVRQVSFKRYLLIFAQQENRINLGFWETAYLPLL